MNDNRKYAIYCRSNNGDIEENILNQRNKCIDTLKANFDVSDDDIVFYTDKGVSSPKDATDLKRLMKSINDNNLKMVVIPSFGVITRSAEVMSTFCNICSENNCQIFVENMGKLLNEEDYMMMSILPYTSSNYSYEGNGNELKDYVDSIDIKSENFETEFMQFLKEGYASNIIFKINNDRFLFLQRVPYNDKLDILYSIDSYDSDIFDLKSGLEYSGIYDKQKDALYDINSTIRWRYLNWDYNDPKNIYMDDLLKNLTDDVNEKVQELVSDSKEEWFDSELCEELKSDMRTVEEDDVYSYFIDGETSNTLEDKYSLYTTSNRKNVLHYLTNKSEFIEDISREYILDNTSKIITGLLISEEKRRLLKGIEDNPEHPLHKIKDIINSIKDKDCKTVGVTINKNGIEQTFKYDAQSLENSYSWSYLSTYNIIKLSEREEFEANFGRHEDFGYQDITKITYGKNVLYEDNNYKTLEEDKCL